MQADGVKQTYQHHPTKKGDEALTLRLKELAVQYPRYGYLMLHELLKREGRVINEKRTYRLYRELKLQIRTKPRKKLDRPRVPMPLPHRVKSRQSALANGFRI